MVDKGQLGEVTQKWKNQSRKFVRENDDQGQQNRVIRGKTNLKKGVRPDNWLGSFRRQGGIGDNTSGIVRINKQLVRITSF